MNRDNQMPSALLTCILPYLVVMGAALAEFILGIGILLLVLMGMAALAASCLMSNILFVASVCLLLLGLYTFVPLLGAWIQTAHRKCWTSLLMREYGGISIWIIGLLAATILVCWAGENLAPGKDRQRIIRFSGKAMIDIPDGNATDTRVNMQLSIKEDEQ